MEAKHGSLLQDVSNAMVALFKEQFGRGPTKVRSDFANDDTLICVLENTFTPAEKNMVKLGEHQRLRDVRLFFQHASEEEFRSTVERIVGRPVRAYTSAIDTRADLCVEVFMFGTPHKADVASQITSPARTRSVGLNPALAATDCEARFSGSMAASTAVIPGCSCSQRVTARTASVATPRPVRSAGSRTRSRRAHDLRSPAPTRALCRPDVTTRSS